MLARRLWLGNARLARPHPRGWTPPRDAARPAVARVPSARRAGSQGALRAMAQVGDALLLALALSVPLRGALLGVNHVAGWIWPFSLMRCPTAAAPGCGSTGRAVGLPLSRATRHGAS